MSDRRVAYDPRVAADAQVAWRAAWEAWDRLLRAGENTGAVSAAHWDAWDAWGRALGLRAALGEEGR